MKRITPAPALLSAPALSSALALFVALAVPAVAQTAPPIISCGQARAVVASNGAAVVRSSAMVYDRFVTDVRFCARGEITRPAFISTTDNQYCPVGFTCVTPSGDRNHE